MQETEFFLQQLIVATRWEFDIPTFLLMAFSIVFMWLAISKRRSLDISSMLLLQLSYLSISAFLYIRFYAAVIRLRKLSYVLVEQNPTFEYWNQAVQMPTYWSRNLLFLVLTVATVNLLLQTRREQARSS